MVTNVTEEVVMVPRCRRCGRCCYYIKNDRLTRCKHLVHLNGKAGLTLCRVYKKRLWKLNQGENLVIDEIQTDEGKRPIICVERTMCKYNYDGCPYNSVHPEKEVAPW